MSARDEFSVGIICPTCNQVGRLHLSEDDHPYMKNLHRAVDSVDGNFCAEATQTAKVHVNCKSCNTNFDFR